MEQENPLVVITGASSGIGAETAITFSRLGFPLLLLARRTKQLNELGLPRTMTAGVDVTDPRAFADALQTAEAKFGPPDCLINNAGLMLLGEIQKQDPSEWQRMFEVNVLGLLNGIRLVLSGMTKRGRGTIINLGSVAGHKTFPQHTAYCGTKFAVHAITENLREEVATNNVRLITIAPGAVETELLSHTASSAIKENYGNWKKSMGGALRPQDVARSILFAYQQPQEVCLREITLAATRQGP